MLKLIRFLLIVLAIILGAFSGIALRKTANWYILPKQPEKNKAANS